MTRPVSVTIVGAGFGGVAAAIELKRQGIVDLTLLERGDGAGGVWLANGYPGAACDVPSHLYSLSFAPNPRWSRRYSPGPEIRAYLSDLIERFGIAEHVRFGQEVASARFDEASGRWSVTVADGTVYESDVLLTACGQLSRPRIPLLPGLDRFAGAAFHSAEWDHSFALDGARVAAVGSGASAIQFVPAIAPRAARTTVFQRSAPWTLPKNDAPYGPRKQSLYARRPALQRLARAWNQFVMESIVPVFTLEPPRRARVTGALLRGLSHAHRALQLRGDRRLMAATRPRDALGCKRLLLTSDWYPTLRRPDVELVTTAIREVVPEGIVTADGRTHAVDAIIFGTGFRATEFLAPMAVSGRDGVTLDTAWSGGAEAYLGMAVPGFPNMFVLYGPNTNHGTGSVLTMHEAQARYIAAAVALLRSGAATRLEVRPDVHARFQAELAQRLARSVWVSGCASWYQTASGRITNNWPGTQAEYVRRTRRVEPADYLLGERSAEPVAA